MLIDLGRNDVGRVAAPATVKVDERMVVERYSHVMHLVSNVSGTLREGKDAVDVVRAAFPTGTLSGAPKIRAMEIIEELEPARRGIYGGAVGLPVVFGQRRPGHRHPHPGHPGRHHPRAGGRGHRGRQPARAASTRSA